MYTDEQIESWLDGNFEGNKDAIEKYLKETEEGRTRLAMTKSFYQALKEQPMPELSFSLSDAVVMQLEKQVTEKPKKELQFVPIILLIIAGIGITAFLFIKKFTFENAFNTLTGGLTGLLVLLFIAMNLIDWSQQRKRYRRLLMP